MGRPFVFNGLGGRRLTRHPSQNGSAADHVFEVPTTLPLASLNDLLTIFLDPSHGSGGIRHVVNDVGGSSTKANPDTPVTVVSYP